MRPQLEVAAVHARGRILLGRIHDVADQLALRVLRQRMAEMPADFPDGLDEALQAALERSGYPVDRSAVADAARKDSGLTAAQLAWLLSELHLGLDSSPPGGVAVEELEMGTRVEGVVVEVREDEVLVELDGKNLGVIELGEFAVGEIPRPGSRIHAGQ